MSATITSCKDEEEEKNAVRERTLEKVTNKPKIEARQNNTSHFERMQNKLKRTWGATARQTKARKGRRKLSLGDAVTTRLYLWHFEKSDAGLNYRQGEALLSFFFFQPPE